MGRRFRPRLPAWLMGWSHILRTLLAFSIALYAAYALELDSPSSAGLTVLIVASASRGAVLSKSLYRAGGTVVASTDSHDAAEVGRYSRILPLLDAVAVS